ncbi:HlyD family secretion protein [Shewanella sp. 10N.286.54.B9]|uniref:HlyD family secretion protein n=1 Tax=Shewanella sp. 10N.286.54.B9 TaxID=3229719 RepID=UPI00354E0824
MQLKSKFANLSCYLMLILLSSSAFAESHAVTATHLQSLVDRAPLLLTGQVSSVNSQTIMVPKAGDAWNYQIQWMLPEGSIAKKGDVVVIFDKSAIANRIEQLEAGLLRVTAQEQNQSIELNAQLLQAVFEVKKAKLELEKADLDAAVPSDYIPARDYAENQFNQMKAQSELSKVEQALKEISDKRSASLSQLLIDKKRAKLELAQALGGLEQLEIYSQISGPILYSRDPWSNSKYAVGDSVRIGRQVAMIPALKDLEIVAWVNEVDVDRLATKMPVNLRLDSQSKVTLVGAIEGISRQATNRVAWGSGNWFRVEIKFSVDNTVKIIPGMSVLVELKEEAS